MDCGPNGACAGRIGGKDFCRCNDGWAGARCTVKLCAAECEAHGECVNGTCVCHPGWNGGKCATPGCGKNADCSRHGRCLKSPSDYLVSGVARDEYR